MVEMDPRDLNALEKALNDAANQAAARWFGFITLAAYLAIATGTVTHRALLLEEPLQLPVLNVQLPLIGFFVIAPFFFIIFHFYVFLQLHGLAGKVAVYDSLLRHQFDAPMDRQLIRQRLDPFLFVQLWAGPQDRREGTISVLLGLVGWITMVAIPLVILLQIEFAFLPYHRESITWAHRVLIALELVMVWTFWSALAKHRRSKKMTNVKLAGAFASVAILAFAVFVAIFPGETIYRFARTPLTELFFEGKFDSDTGRIAGPFSNRLNVSYQTLVDIDKVPKVDVTIPLRGRNLQQAMLVRSDLRKADFTGANLLGATLIGSRFSKAQFRCFNDKLIESCADIRGADLSYADLAEADLTSVRATAANFSYAHLENTSLPAARLEGASFSDAHMKDAMLIGAFVDGTAFIGAHDFAPVADTILGASWIAPDKILDNAAMGTLADVLIDIACRKDGGPHLARGLIENRNFTHTGAQIAKIEKKILGRAGDCAGAAGLTSDERATFKTEVENTEMLAEPASGS